MNASPAERADDVSPQTLRLRIEWLRVATHYDGYAVRTRLDVADFLRSLHDPYIAGLAECLLDAHPRVRVSTTPN